MKENKNKLSVIDGETLMDTRLDPIKFCVQTLLPQGIGILSGASKSGKSWWVLDSCVKIAKGEPMWGFETLQGTVLYLCLEDNLSRIQSRLNDITDEVPPNVFFTTAAGTIADGLVEQIETFIAEHPDTMFVVIDTFRMVRQSTVDNSYSNDYHDIIMLKNIAYKFEICLLLVHHVNKKEYEDSFNKISGTNGIGGAVDSVFVLEENKQNPNHSKLQCKGRDIERRTLEICFSKETHQWGLIADSLDEPAMMIDPEVNLFAKFVFCIGSFSGSNTELADLYTSETQKRVTPKLLKQMMNKHRFELEALGVFFESKRSNGQRFVRVWYESDSSAVNDANSTTPTGVEICVPCVPSDPDDEVAV